MNAREELTDRIDREVNYPGEQKTSEAIVEFLEDHRDLVLAALGGEQLGAQEHFWADGIPVWGFDPLRLT